MVTKKMTITYKERIKYNHCYQTYGKAVRINKYKVKAMLFLIASLPLFTAWLYAIIPFIKNDWVIRW